MPLADAGWGYLEWTTAGAQRYLVDLGVSGDGFGSYIVSNHFSTAVSLKFPITIAAWLFFSRGRIPSSRRYLAAVAMLAEAGLVGLIVLVALATVMVRRFATFLATAVPPERVLDAGPWAALAGIAAHSFFDWNLHVPANALLACIATGLAAASGVSEAVSKTVITNPTARIGSRIALALACLGSLALLARDAYSSSVCKRMQMALVKDAQATKKQEPTAAKPVLAAAATTGENAARWDPANPRLAVLLGQLNLRLALAATAGRPADSQAAADHEATAERWFLRARMNCAACRGLAEPLPPAPRK